MTTATAAFFEELEQRGYEPSLQTVSGTVRFDIMGEGSWWVTVNGGAITVARTGTRSDCTVSIEAHDFVPLVRRELNPFAAALQGRAQFTGDTALALVSMSTFS
jgi:putative sterol carrier protein